MSFGADFFIPKASLAFTQLRKMFIKAPILYHFNPKHHIWIETDASGYVINRVLSQLTTEKRLACQMTYKTNNFNQSINLLSEIGQWYLVAFFSQKLISVETR